MRILVLCTGNSCRSQMAEGFLKALDPSLEVHSAGTQPSGEVHPLAIRVMKEKGIDISGGRPEHVDDYLGQEFDHVVTVCDGAKENCPVFTGKVWSRKHIGFEDPAEARGSESEVLAVFRRIRDEIEEDFTTFLKELNDKNS